MAIALPSRTIGWGHPSVLSKHKDWALSLAQNHLTDPSPHHLGLLDSWALAEGEWGYGQQRGVSNGRGQLDNLPYDPGIFISGAISSVDVGKGEKLG